MLSGLKTKDGIQDGHQIKIFNNILNVLPYIYMVYKIYGIHIWASSGLDTDLIKSK